MTKVIGITGLAGHGKTTVANMIAESYGYQEYALASPIKNTINNMFGWDDRHSNGVMKEEEQYTRVVHLSSLPIFLWQCFPEEDLDVSLARDFVAVFSKYQTYDLHGVLQYKISPRKAYQLFGTEFGRNCIDDEVWLDMIPEGRVVVSDVRFDNEAEYIVRNGGRIIKVVANRATTKANDHVSEKGVDLSYISATIENTGTMEQLKEKVETVCQLIM
jgi:hypothetical protein